MKSRKQQIADAIREANPLHTARPTKHARRVLAIRARDGSRCWLCGKVLNTRLSTAGRFVEITLDHVVPRSHNGPSKIDNLRLAHQECNGKRSSDPAEPHPQWVADRNARRARGKR